VIKISDEGIGISNADQKMLFEPFYRGSNIKSIPGTGLGLSIVKKSVDLHGGKIELKKRSGKGTTFIVHIPALD
ncbi:MAG: HAMP domain-containing sensor histidine kinase, partial [Bacteroidota bacterium]